MCCSFAPAVPQQPRPYGAPVPLTLLSQLTFLLFSVSGFSRLTVRIEKGFKEKMICVGAAKIDHPVPKFEQASANALARYAGLCLPCYL